MLIMNGDTIGDKTIQSQTDLTDDANVSDEILAVVRDKIERKEVYDHDGHRKRVVDRYLNYPQSFKDHELLELILFNAMPRVNTNPVAHKLMTRFSCIRNIFEAEPQDLLEVEGVTESMVAYLKTYAMIESKLYTQHKGRKLNLQDECKMLIKEFGGHRNEHIFYITATEDKTVMSKLIYTLNDPDRVRLSAPILKNIMKTGNTKYLLVAHNHPTDDPNPSIDDIFCYKKILYHTADLGVKLVDFCIICNHSYLSFNLSELSKRLETCRFPQKLMDGDKLFPFKKKEKPLDSEKVDNDAFAKLAVEYPDYFKALDPLAEIKRKKEEERQKRAEKAKEKAEERAKKPQSDGKEQPRKKKTSDKDVYKEILDGADKYGF